MIRLPPRIVRLVVGEIQTNCYVLWSPDEAEAVVVDPGAEGARIAAELVSRNAVLRAVFLTHAHIDHLHGLPELFDAVGPAPVLLHGDDWPLWNAMGPQAAFLGVSEPRLPANVREIVDGEVVEESGWTMEVHHTPGHSPGGVCVFLRDHGILLSGDTLFKSGVGRTDLWGGRGDQLLRSLRDRIFTLPAQTIVLPGHGDFTTVGEAVLWAARAGLAVGSQASS
ncbi:MAG: MBL fold metallo-hydrolase [Candidatus Eisenbacteria bacterium]|jgi:glyoxylase-like metal-dependent hydrolase (beta-lactamase superfamily II)|nr:MBL fold metallo-hydrolase [Candidatus Eisenbacteria bacterium]